MYGRRRSRPGTRSSASTREAKASAEVHGWSGGYEWQSPVRQDNCFRGPEWNEILLEFAPLCRLVPIEKGSVAGAVSRGNCSSSSLMFFLGCSMHADWILNFVSQLSCGPQEIGKLKKCDLDRFGSQTFVRKPHR